MISLSTGIVDETMTALSSARRLDCYDLTELSEAGITSGVALKTAIEFAQDNGWIKVTGNSFMLTSLGEHIMADFNGWSISPQIWRDILKGYVYLCYPSWASRIPAGRKEAYLFMQPDEQRCFAEAGLMDDPPSQVVIDWWIKVADEMRAKRNMALEDTGRIGENLTLEYEERRIGIRPKWEAFESNCVGYDIISRVGKQDARTRLIEVKTSQSTIDSAAMIISRNEWEVATHTPQNVEYRFYLWSVHDHAMLAILTPTWIAPHVPTDGITGTWTNVKIPFGPFKDQFVEVQESQGEGEERV